MQLAAYAGIYGLSFVTIVAAALPALLAAPAGPESWILRRPWLPLALPLVIVAALWGGGAWRLTQAPDPASPDAMQPGIRLRVVQPNIAESLKWQPARLRANLLEMVQTSRVGLDGDKLLIWPEASVPYDLGSEPELRHALGAILPKDGYLATGTPRREPNEGGTGDNAFRYFNSLELVDHAGDIVATYDKSHLVPYGEYVPMRSILPIAKITPGTIDFSSGPGPRTVSVPGLPPFGVLICYEAIFPDEAVERDHRPDWLLNVTNDAWFGTSSGPYQHFESTRMRAVEQGLPLVRAANTGISGVIDPYGRVLTRVGLGERRVFDSGLPRPLAEPTPYARFGDATLILLIAFATALAWLLRKLR
jgi:apolipoprotein N-acyltransferase